MTRGCLQAQITIPTGGWSVSVTITAIGGPYTCTVAAGTYYPSDLLPALEAQLDAASGADGDFFVTGSFGESGTGLVTISHTIQTFTLTWTSTDLRDALGFTGTLTPAATSFTGTRWAQGVWLPDCGMAAKYGSADAGHTESDMGMTISPLGHINATCYSTRVMQPSIMWSHVTRQRARIQGESVTGESFESFIRKTQFGELSYFAVRAPIRVIWDADSAGSYATYRLTGWTSTAMERAVTEWTGLWPIEIAGYVVPS